MKYEAWFQFTNWKKKKKSLLSDDCDAAWNMDAVHVARPGWLSRVQLRLWQSKLRQVRQNVLNGRESEWTSHHQPGIYKQKYYVTIDTKCLSTDGTPCGPGSDKMHVPQCASHLPLFQKTLECLFFLFPQRRLGSTVQLDGGVGGR